jgi:DNA-directed RNA polymerase specialized sigma54-like protein
MLSQSLVQKQTQKLIMTQDLRQSIELLPLSTQELAEKIQNEIIENPLLEEIILYLSPKKSAANFMPIPNSFNCDEFSGIRDGSSPYSKLSKENPGPLSKIDMKSLSIIISMSKEFVKFEFNLA